VAANAIAGGTMIGWSIADVPLESFDAGGWVRNLALAAVALLAPPVLSAAVMRGTPMPAFAQVIGPRANRARDPLALAAGLLLIAVMLLAIQSALGLVFDPRYRDFPFASLTAASVPFMAHHLLAKREPMPRAVSELAGAALLALAVPYIVINETLANWQSLWLCACFAALAFILARARGGQN
jgi:glucan 1,3-beta-glucosidase